jgi:hypothetical protein
VVKIMQHLSSRTFGTKIGNFGTEIGVFWNGFVTNLEFCDGNETFSPYRLKGYPMAEPYHVDGR